VGATATRKAAELYERASALQRAGDLPEAAKLYRQVIAHDENHFEAHVNLGVALQGLGMLELARSQYERALAIVPDHAWAHCNFGTALLEEGDECFGESQTGSLPSGHTTVGGLRRNHGGHLPMLEKLHFRCKK